MAEEIGVKLRRLEFAGTYWFEKKELLMHAFIGYAEKCKFTLSEEVEEAKWVPAADAKRYMFPDGEGNNWNFLYKKYMRKAGKHYE